MPHENETPKRQHSITPLLAFSALLCGHLQSAEALKTETFDRALGWEDHNNRVVPKVAKVVRRGLHRPVN